MSVADRSSSPVIISQPGCTHCCFCCYMGEIGGGGANGTVQLLSTSPSPGFPSRRYLLSTVKKSITNSTRIGSAICRTEIQIRRLATKSLSRRYITLVDATLPKEKLIGTCSSTNPVACCPPCRNGDIVSISHRKSFQLDERTDDQ